MLQDAELASECSDIFQPALSLLLQDRAREFVIETPEESAGQIKHILEMKPGIESPKMLADLLETAVGQCCIVTHDQSCPFCEQHTLEYWVEKTTKKPVLQCSDCQSVYSLERQQYAGNELTYPALRDNLRGLVKQVQVVLGHKSVLERLLDL